MPLPDTLVIKGYVAIDMPEGDDGDNWSSHKGEALALAETMFEKVNLPRVELSDLIRNTSPYESGPFVRIIGGCPRRDEREYIYAAEGRFETPLGHT